MYNLFFSERTDFAKISFDVQNVQKYPGSPDPDSDPDPEKIILIRIPEFVEAVAPMAGVP